MIINPITGCGHRVAAQVSTWPFPSIFWLHANISMNNLVHSDISPFSPLSASPSLIYSVSSYDVVIYDLTFSAWLWIGGFWCLTLHHLWCGLGLYCNISYLMRRFFDAILLLMSKICRWQRYWECQYMQQSDPWFQVDASCLLIFPAGSIVFTTLGMKSNGSNNISQRLKAFQIVKDLSK